MSKQFKSAPGWLLAEHTLVSQRSDDAVNPGGSQTASVVAYKSDRFDDAHAYVKLGIWGAGFDVSSKMTPATARIVAQALLEAAVICEAFDIQQVKAAV